MNKTNCSREKCCTIQYGEDAGVCMLDNCTCHSPKTSDSEDWEDKLLTIVLSLEGSTSRGTKVRTLTDFMRTVRTAAYQQGRFDEGETCGYDQGYESGFIEEQKHAFGVDRAHVKKEGYESALREALEVVPDNRMLLDPKIEECREAIERLLDT